MIEQIHKPTKIVQMFSFIKYKIYDFQNIMFQPANTAPDVHMMSSTQRAALSHANSQSFGFFVPQDSSFGNLILPVLPRFED